MRGFDKDLHELLETHPKAALEHAKLFAELPLTTQLAVMRRRGELSQPALAKKLRVPLFLALNTGLVVLLLIGWLEVNRRLTGIEERLTQTAVAPEMVMLFRAPATTSNQDRSDCYWTEPSHFESRTCEVGSYVAGEKGEGFEFKSLLCCRLPK